MKTALMDCNTIQSPDNKPAYTGNEPHDGATKDETPRLGTVRLHELDEPWSLYALRNEDSNKHIANTLEQGIQDAYEGQPGFHTKSPPQALLPAVSKSPVGINVSKSTYQ
jgi:hypothetical protein